MEMRFDRISVPMLFDAVREVKQTELTQELKLTDGLPDIGRVLNCTGQLLLRSKEWGRDGITVSAGTMVYCQYLPEEGSEVRSVETWIPFQLSWDVPQDLAEGHIRILPLLRFVDGRCVSSRKMMIRVGISALCHGFTPGTVEIPKVGELPEDIQILTRTYPVMLPREAGEKTFVLDEELKLSESEPGMEKLISCTLHPEITDRKVMSSRLVFKGNGNLRVLYRSSGGELVARDFEIPFSQYADLEGAYSPEAKADLVSAVTNLEADLMTADQLRLKGGIVSQYRIDDREILEVPEDAYSPSRDVKVERETLHIPALLDNRREAVVVRQETAGRLDRVTDVSFLPDFPRQKRSGERIDLEMPGQFQMIGVGEDGSLQGVNSRWEGNMSINSDENTYLEAIPYATGVAVGESAGDSTRLNARMELQLRSTTKTPIPAVSGLEIGEEREMDRNRPTLILRRAGEDELWEIAKQAGSTVDAIRKANGLEGEPERDRMLLIPVAR